EQDHDAPVGRRPLAGGGLVGRVHDLRLALRHLELPDVRAADMQRGVRVVAQLADLEAVGGGGDAQYALFGVPVVEDGRQVRAAGAPDAREHTELLLPQQLGELLIGEYPGRGAVVLGGAGGGLGGGGLTQGVGLSELRTGGAGPSCSVVRVAVAVVVFSRWGSALRWWGRGWGGSGGCAAGGVPRVGGRLSGGPALGAAQHREGDGEGGDQEPRAHREGEP